ncbi:hypothetical protein B0T09DRAFT_329267 [Sordaria sp. MPI-SDFR-AT-0083]|nr:hypothetical protein B0T09DRAFT_329267 [Sordaria sp. MPI-SDFR-AT-0083]
MSVSLCVLVSFSLSDCSCWGLSQCSIEFCVALRCAVWKWYQVQLAITSSSSVLRVSCSPCCNYVDLVSFLDMDRFVRNVGFSNCRVWGSWFKGTESASIASLV